MGLITSGQVTIVDNNDARPITALLSAAPGAQQVFTKDESSTSYLPDWSTGGFLVLTPKAYIGGIGASVDISAALTNQKWSTSIGGAAITGSAALISTAAPLAAAFVGTGNFTAVAVTGTQPTLTLRANLLDSVQAVTIYFEGDYTDPATSLVSRVVTQIPLNMVKTGTNAVFVQTRGSSMIEEATGATKNVAVVTADLLRAAGVDVTGVTYRFFDANGGAQISNTAPNLLKYGLKSTAFSASPVGALADIGTNLLGAGVFSPNNTLVMNENAVTDIGIFRVEAKDADGTIYQSYFTIYDVSDPYQCNIISSSGDKLQNGVGSTNLTPEVFYGATKVNDISAYTFLWTFFNRSGLRGAFIDTTKTAVAGGRNITAQTGTTTAQFNYDGANIVFAVGDIIKAVMPAAGNFAESFFEVGSVGANFITIRAPSTNAAWLSFTGFPAPAAGQFNGGKLYACVGSNGQKTTSGTAFVSLSGDEVDVKAKIAVDASRP